MKARDEVRVFSPVDGIVSDLRIQLGQVVTNGELAVALDDTELKLRELAIERELAQTEAALENNRIAREERAVKPGAAELILADDRKIRLSRIAEIQQDIEKNYANARDLQIISELEVRRQEIERLRSELDLLQASLLADWQKAGVSGFETERLEAEHKRLEAMIQLAGRERDLVQGQRARTRIVAPMDGQIVALNPRFSGASVARGAELFKIATTGGPYRVRAYIPERNVDLVQVGKRAIMESAVFQSMLEGYVEGVVVRVAPEGAEEEGASTRETRYEVDIDVEHSPYPLALGSGVDVRIMLGRRPLTDLFFKSGSSLRPPASKHATKDL